MTKQLDSFLGGAWVAGDGDPIALVNPTNEETVATVKAVASLAEAMAWARDVGGPNLRAMNFVERGALLKQMQETLYAAREELLDLATVNGGNTRGDAKFDVDGAIGVLSTYAYLAKQLGERKFILDGEEQHLVRTGKMRAQHVRTPRLGLAVHINAFNFPAWGMIGKAAVSLLAGMPVLTKPATSTAVVAHRIVELLDAGGFMPEGALSLLMGPAGDLLDHVGPQDVVAFTGSAWTGAKIRSHARVVELGVRVNVEADSLNAIVVGPDVERGSELFDLVVNNLVTEMTQKAGQKCTATRRVIVPEGLVADLEETVVERLDEIAARTGDPSDKSNRMGPLATSSQLRDGRAGVAALQASATIVRGDPERAEFNGVAAGTGYFLEPILLRATPEAALDPASAFHTTEVFGPVATLLPYDGTVETAARIVGLGSGSLVSTVYTDDRAFTKAALLEIAPHLGRMVIASEKTAAASFSPGMVFPLTNHGGPGRAGGGEELGGVSGLSLYMQRTAIQGGASQLARLLG